MREISLSILNSLLLAFVTENHRPVDNQIFGGSNLGTVAIIPASEDVPISNFSFELSLALHSIGKQCKQTNKQTNKQTTNRQGVKQ